LLGDSPFLGTDLTKRQYPPHRIRQVMALRLAHRYVTERWDASLGEQVWGAFIHASAAAERAYEAVTGEPPATQGLKEAWSDVAWHHVKDNLLEHWKDKVYPELLHGDYARGPLAF
jgi:hypothetical protein